MRVPLHWLRAYADPDLSAAEVAERLDMTGTEVERVERVGVGATDNFVVGRVLKAERHPDADRLSICEVDDGSGHPRTIVCGAPNVATGQTVAVALPGAVMPDGLPAGAPLHEHLPITDEVLELEITPNRPDCLAVYGIAREVHAATGAAISEDPTAADAQPSGGDRVEDHAAVEVADPDICLRFTARVFEDVTIAPSPQWLRQRLAAVGQRAISNVVDITNYVMLTCGQPLHAFDLDEVRGARIVVRRAQRGERMVTLDDVERSFDPDVALVCDAEGPSGIAGIMGGQISEVSEQTTRVLMEAATWVGPNILRSSKKLGLRTEASARFEKQLHPELAMAGQRLAAKLMVELCGARMVPGTIDVYPRPAEPRIVELRVQRVEGLLGQTIPAGEIRAILEVLGFAVHAEDPSVMSVTVPHWRDMDVQREADLIEEVARIHGVERLPITLPSRRRAVGRLKPEQRLRRRLEDSLRDRGLHEVVSWSFLAPEALERLRLGDVPTLRMANPLSEDASIMRPLLLPGLLDAASHNVAHGASELALFESAHVYLPGQSLEAPEGSPRGKTPATEGRHLGGLLTEAAPGTWRRERVPADFFAAKAVVDAVMGVAGVQHSVEPATQPFLHPGRSASVRMADGGEAGWIGELHPLVARGWGLEGAAAFELDVEAVAAQAAGVAEFEDVTSYPSVLQDIAVISPQDVSAAMVVGAVRRAGGRLLQDARVFDVYAGEQVGQGNRSLALRLDFRAPDRTLTDEEVAESRKAIEAALAEIGGRLRG